MLVLASSSPRRRELLTQAGYTFTVAPAHIPEDPLSGESPIAYVVRLAREKAEAVCAQLTPNENEPILVLGADTTVVAPNGEILGKPVDATDAARMLRLLAGATHQVITGVALVTQAGIEIAAEVTHVRILTLSDEEIAAYIATRRAHGQSRCLRHPGPRRPLDPAHHRRLLQRRRIAPGAGLELIEGPNRHVDKTVITETAAASSI